MVKPTDVSSVIRAKVAVVGDAAVGKTALVSMFASKGQKFPAHYIMTSGVDVVVAQVPLPDPSAPPGSPHPVAELLLLDSGGHDAYREALSGYWGGLHYAMLVYDITNADSYESCKMWLEEHLKKARPDKDRPLKAVLVATKTDVPPQRHQASSDVARDWAVSNGMDFFEVSAAPPGRDFDAPFVCLARALQKNLEDTVAAYTDACKNY